MNYDNLETNLERFLILDTATQERIKDPVRFPNHPNNPNPLFERETMVQLFNNTRTDIQNVTRLQEMSTNLRQNLQNSLQNRQLIEQLAEQILGNHTLDQVLQGEGLLVILDGAGIADNVIPPNLQDQINFTLTVIHGQALNTARNKVQGLTPGQTKCPLTRATLSQNNMQSLRVIRNIFFVAARNAILNNPHEFCDYQKNDKSNFEANYRSLTSSRKKTADLIDCLKTLSERDIIEAENLLSFLLKDINTRLTRQEVEILDGWGINSNNSTRISTPRQHLGCTSNLLVTFINSNAAESTRNLTRVNTLQSTSIDGVDASVNLSIKRLIVRYPAFASNVPEHTRTSTTDTAIQSINTMLQNLSPDDLYRAVRTQVQRWNVIQAIVFEQFPKGKIQRLESTEVYKQRINKEWPGYVEQLDATNKPRFLTAIKNASLGGFKKLAVPGSSYYGNDSPMQSPLKNRELVALIWTAIHDRNTVMNAQNRCIANTPTNQNQINNNIQSKEINLAVAFFELATEYGDNNACSHGSKNKVVETLNLSHPDVIVIEDTALTVRNQTFEHVKTKILRPLFQTFQNKDKDNLQRIWDLDAPSAEERVILNDFKRRLNQRMQDSLPDFIKTNFPALNPLPDTNTLVQLVMKHLHEMTLVEQQQQFVRKPIPLLNYEKEVQKLERMHIPQIRAQARAQRSVKVNQLARKIDLVLVELGVPIASNPDDDDRAQEIASNIAQVLITKENKSLEYKSTYIRNTIGRELATLLSNQQREEVIRRTIVAITSPEVPVNRPLLLGYDATVENNLGTTGVNIPFQVLNNNIGLNNFKRLTLNVQNTGFQGATSGPYGHDLGLPCMPVIHPHHPHGENQNNELSEYDDDDNNNNNNGIPSFMITAAIPQGTIGNLPSGVREQLIQYGININNLKVFFCAQTKPWRNETLLLRPHPWLHPDATRQGNYNRQSNIFASVSDLNGQFSQLASINGVSTHPDNNGNIVYSAKQMPIQGISAPDKTDAFYSFCIDPQTGRAALTLHWLVNQQDEELIKMVMNQQNLNLNKLSMLMAGLDNSQISGTLQPVPDFTPAEALHALVFGNQPKPNQQRSSKYRLQEQVTLELDRTKSLDKVSPSEALFSLLAQYNDTEALQRLIKEEKETLNLDINIPHTGENRTLLDYARDYKCFNTHQYLIQKKLQQKLQPPTELMFSLLAQTKDEDAYKLITAQPAYVNPNAIHSGDNLTLLMYAHKYGCKKTEEELKNIDRAFLTNKNY